MRAGKAAKQSRILYLSYDGMTDPLGRSQVLPYLAGLADLGHRFTLISCEKPGRNSAEWRAVRVICSDAGIEWHPLRYRKWPPIVSTMIDLGAMRRLAGRLHATRAFDIVHCRSYLTALVGLGMKRRFGTRFLFDMRGFWVEERFERGIWSGRNPLFRAVGRFFKSRERQFLANADGIVTLTSAARDRLASRAGMSAIAGPVAVIPCCVDLALFNPAGGSARKSGRAALGLGARVPVMLYLGTISGAYLIDEMFAVFRAFRALRPGARFLFVTAHPPDQVRALATRNGVDESELIVRSATRAEVPALVAAADIGVSLSAPISAAVASSPTKLGEMLAMGVPVIANAGVGDIGDILGAGKAGVAVDGFDAATLTAAVRRMIEHPPSRPTVRALARRWFDLATGIEAYDRLYRSLR